MDNLKREDLRRDIKEQFELPDMPPPMTKRRAVDFQRPCARCDVAQCQCIGWKAFEPARVGL